MLSTTSKISNSVVISPLIFDYGVFLNYYKNNVKTSKNPPILKYTNKGGVFSKPTSNKYIFIGGNKVYISILPANRSPDRIADALLFITPTQVNGELWDVHYHFGVRDQFTNKNRGVKNINAIYFHKTSQHSTNIKHKNCYFFTNQDITDVENIECLESGTGSRISGNDKFPMTGPDFAIIREIIQRPFLGVRFGGKTRKHTRRRKHTRKRTSIM
jgi:hypothetical protein